METVSSALFGRYIDNFLSLVEENIKAFKNCPSEFKLMKENAVRIQNFVDDIQTLNHGMKSLNHFANEMRELMYELEDITTDYSRMGISSRLGIGKKLKDINKKIETMQSRMEAFLKLASQNKKAIVPRRPCDPINDMTEIVGFDNAVSKIKKWVMNEDKEWKAKYNCIGLVGKGGSGKTTLAQMILKDEDINHHFHLKMMFVTVAQPVDVKTMMHSMLKKLKVGASDDDDEAQ